MELMDFILARIADDENFAKSAQITAASPLPSRGKQVRPTVTAARSPERIIEECTAKRELLSCIEEYEVATSGTPDWDLVVAMKWLAYPYRDHDDFESVWAV